MYQCIKRDRRLCVCKERQGYCVWLCIKRDGEIVCVCNERQGDCVCL